jgi:hypothetical protein
MILLLAELFFASILLPGTGLQTFPLLREGGPSGVCTEQVLSSGKLAGEILWGGTPIANLDTTSYKTPAAKRLKHFVWHSTEG